MRRPLALVLAWLAAGSVVVAQDAIPGVPAVPGVPAAAAPSSLAAPAAPTKNLWSMLLPSQSQCAQCKQKLCNCALGQLLNGMLTPLSGLTGGTLGPLCPAVNPNDLNQPADSAEGAAARIAADQAGAAARIKAVQYMATADCRYYPEAEAALINSLRADKVECVRIAAAKAFLTGCCCNKRTIAALTRSVNGDDKDGNPGERSECVRAIAFLALQRCLAKYSEPATPPEPGDKAPAEKPEKKVADAGVSGSVVLTAYYSRIEASPAPVVVAEARAVAARGMHISRETLAQIRGGPKTVAAIVTGAGQQQTAAVPAKPEAPAIQPVEYREMVPVSKPRSLLRLWNEAKTGG